MAEAGAASILDRRVDHLLADVAEGRVAEIVAVADRLRQILVQPERPGDVAGDPGRLERVGHPRSVMVALGRDEDLRLVLEPPEGLRVHDSVAVALERGPVQRVRLRSLAVGRIGAGRLGRQVLRLEGTRTCLEGMLDSILLTGSAHRDDSRLDTPEPPHGRAAPPGRRR